jgi:molybdopterin molybdotransferase
MISVREALSIIEKTAFRLPTELVLLKDALGQVLSADIHSPIDFPPFSQSAMDGYALGQPDGLLFSMLGEIKAGDDASLLGVEKGQAYRIFTGAMIPHGTWAVVRQEDVQNEYENIVINPLPNEMANVRLIGESIQKGGCAVKKETVVTPAVVGFLASLGVRSVSVYRQPKVAIISTGDELLSPNEELVTGKIYESNAVMLSVALHQYGFVNYSIHQLQDDKLQITATIAQLLDNYDIVLLSGGISVGEYDFVELALRENGVEQLFHKVQQKPGKPMYYGVKGDVRIVALPGNPAAALTLFYIYVLPLLNFAKGRSFSGLKKAVFKAVNTFGKIEPRTQFLKALVNDTNNTVTILGGQSSAMLQTFVEANAIVVINEGEVVEEGTNCVVYLI